MASLFLCKYVNSKELLPLAIDGQVVNWIESKALFGDEEIHRGYLKDQLFSYWNRYSKLLFYKSIFLMDCNRLV